MLNDRKKEGRNGDGLPFSIMDKQRCIWSAQAAARQLLQASIRFVHSKFLVYLGDNDVVHQTVSFSLLRAHKMVAVRILVDLFQALACMLG